MLFLPYYNEEVDAVKLIVMSMLLLLGSVNSSPEHVTITNQGEVLDTLDRNYYSLYGVNNIFVDELKVNNILQHVNKKVYKSPTDAKVNDQGQIVSDQRGYRLDKEKLNVFLHKFFYEGKPTKIEVPKVYIYSPITSEFLANIYVDKIGEYSTYYKEKDVDRSHNIALAVNSINNQVVFPGETFSFNEVVGERTEKTGYKRAPVIVKGELDEDIGGGICQVSSTLFNAVTLQGIQIIERYSHSKSVPYVPPGKDAAVSWWGPDFVFKNKFNEPILILARSSQGKVEISIYTAENVGYINDFK